MEWEARSPDATLIANLVDDAIQQSQFNLQMTVQFMRTGCYIALALGGGHNAHWKLDWEAKNPNILDTGIDLLVIADPSFSQSELVNYIDRIGVMMTSFCACGACKERCRVNSV
jgi:hypothetical protein